MDELILFQLFIIFFLARLFGEVFERLQQPAVVGELLVGIILGNTILYERLHLAGSEDGLGLLAELGVVFLLFSVGLESSVSEMKRTGRTSLLVAVLGVVVPFAFGYSLMIAFRGSQIEALFVAAAMMATSVGVTASVLRSMGFLSRLESRIILGAAVIDDIIGMIVLAVISSMGGGEDQPHAIAIKVAVAVIFVLVAIIVGETFVRRLAGRGAAIEGEPTRKRTTVATMMKHESPVFMLAVAICLGFSALASFLHLAAIIGAFLAGVAFAELREKHALDVKMRPITDLLTPFFFVVMGLSVDLGGIGDVWLLATLVAILAILSKFVGCGMAAKGLGLHKAMRVGIGMIPRGEVGIIVALVGLRLHTISNSLYSVVVIMSMITTLVAPPLLKLSFRGEKRVGE